MTIPWIQIYSNLLDHPKTYRLADKLKLTSPLVEPNALAAAMLVGLWTWAAQNADSGDLSACGPRAIANACRWKKSPDALVEALISCGWLEPGMMIHDWEEYASLLIEAKEAGRAKTRERVAKHRAKKKQPPPVTSQDCNANVTVTCNADCNVTDAACNAPTKPNHTKPYLKAPDLPSENHNPVPPTNPAFTHTARARGGMAGDDGFPKFWEAYPRKSGDIKSAYREYCFALEDGATLAEMLAALDWQRVQPSWTENGGQYVPSPEKWLHNKGWTQKKPEPEQPKERGRYGKPAPSPEPTPEETRRQIEDMKKLYGSMLTGKSGEGAAE